MLSFVSRNQIGNCEIKKELNTSEGTFKYWLLYPFKDIYCPGSLFMLKLFLLRLGNVALSDIGK